MMHLCTKFCFSRFNGLENRFLGFHFVLKNATFQTFSTRDGTSSNGVEKSLGAFLILGGVFGEIL